MLLKNIEYLFAVFCELFEFDLGLIYTTCTLYGIAV